MKMKVSTFVNMSSAILFTSLLSSPVMAGCNPKCASGVSCRYEAASGKYHCDVSSNFKDGRGVLEKRREPGSVNIQGGSREKKILSR